MVASDKSAYKGVVLKKATERICDHGTIFNRGV